MNKGEDNFKLSDARWNDVNVVSSLLKSFFRKLPDPLFTLDLYSDFIEMSKVDEPSRRLRGLKGLVHELPEHNFETLKFVCCHLKRVMERSDANKMELRNLAIVFGPTLVRTSDDNMLSMVTDMAQQCRIIESILSNCDWFFSSEDRFEIPVERKRSDPASTEQTEFTQSGAQSLLLSNLHKLEESRKFPGSSSGRDNVSAKDIVTGIISAANRKMLRAAAGSSSKLKKDSSDASNYFPAPGTNESGKQPPPLSKRASCSEIPSTGSRRNSESVLHGTAAAIASAVPQMMSHLVSSHHHHHSSSISNISVTSSTSSSRSAGKSASTSAQESSKSLLRSSREFLARSWTSAQNFMDDATYDFAMPPPPTTSLLPPNKSGAKFPVDPFQGLDESMAKRIRQFEDESREMTASAFRQIAKSATETSMTSTGFRHFLFFYGVCF